MLEKIVLGIELALTTIHTFLVYPRDRGNEQAGGTSVQLEGKLFQLLDEVYQKSDNECDIDIAFNPTGGAIQDNAVRSLILSYLNNSTLANGREIATALKTVTTNRSGVGMLFLMSGLENGEHKVVVSRFPADNGILAEEAQTGLNVEFLERVFMKSQHSYKAAVFRGRSLAAGFWQGRAIDRQSGNPLLQVSDYWVRGFLDADFRTTSAAGTRRLADAIRAASQTTRDSSVRTEIIAAATLASNLAGQQTSIDDFVQRFGLTPAAANAIRSQLRNPATAADAFIFAADDITRQIAFRSVELSSGAILTAQAAEFDVVFTKEDLGGGLVRYSTTGEVVGERLRKVS